MKRHDVIKYFMSGRSYPLCRPVCKRLRQSRRRLVLINCQGQTMVSILLYPIGMTVITTAQSCDKDQDRFRWMMFAYTAHSKTWARFGKTVNWPSFMVWAIQAPIDLISNLCAVGNRRRRHQCRAKWVAHGRY